MLQWWWVILSYFQPVSQMYKAWKHDKRDQLASKEPTIFYRHIAKSGITQKKC